ncbi:unnamed protein product [Heterobilharzia americana]|nr:unnamed protein product [Heterobilharzia americana]
MDILNNSSGKPYFIVVNTFKLSHCYSPNQKTDRFIIYVCKPVRMKELTFNMSSTVLESVRIKTDVNTCCLLSSKYTNWSTDDMNLTGNNTAMLSQWRHVLTIFTTCLLIALTFIVFFGNLLVILAVLKTKRLRRVTDLYIVSLTVADLLVAVLILPFSIIRQYYGYWPYESHELCLYFLSANIFLCVSSILNVCCISIDRYIAITSPMKYIGKRTRQTALAMIIFAWSASFIAMLPPLLGAQHHTGVRNCYVRSDAWYRILTGALAFYIPFPLVGFIYLRIFWVIHSRRKAFKSVRFSSKLKEHRYGSLSILFQLNGLGRIKRWLRADDFTKCRLFVLHSKKSEICTTYISENRCKQMTQITLNFSNKDDISLKETYIPSESCSTFKDPNIQLVKGISDTVTSLEEPIG